MSKKIYIGSTEIAGSDGKSAYQSWLDQGNVGTEAQFLASLKGADGKDGKDGAQGNTGSSVDYPYELVNNVTTNDATKGLSAAQGVVLDKKISQLGLEVDEMGDTLQSEIDAIAPIVIQGDVTNAPDEEDITTDTNDLLKFKDRVAGVGQKGYKILRKNATFASQVTAANTIYEIRYNFDLGGASVTIPSGCVLKFTGGTLRNGTIDASGALFAAPKVQIFKDIIFTKGFRNGTIYPEHFGCVGDGVTDDTACFRQCVKYMNDTGAKLLIYNGQYLLSGPVNYYDGDYNDITFNITGLVQKKLSLYRLDYRGGIKVVDGGTFVANKIIRGSIDSVAFVGTRNLSTNFAVDCEFKEFTLSNCCISNFGAFLFDTQLTSVSSIHDNRFLSVYYFARTVSASPGMIDSELYNNYINGGMEQNDNSCFEFSYYNGSVIHHNFIDYYRIIFNPKAQTRQASGQITSLNNNYEVFRYFYYVAPDTNLNSFSLKSDGDIFNWTDPAKLAKLAAYQELTYKGRDNTDYTLPPYIFVSSNNFESVTITNAVLENNLGNILFLLGGGTSYASSINRFHIANFSDRYESLYAIAEGGNSSWNNGTYKWHYVDTNFVIPLSEIPSNSELTVVWSKFPYGTKIRVNGIVYTAKRVFENGAFEARWTIEQVVTPTSLYNGGTSENRPTIAPTGTTYYDTTLNKLIVKVGNAWKNVDGSNL